MAYGESIFFTVIKINKSPEFYVIIALKYFPRFFLGGGVGGGDSCPPWPPSPTPMSLNHSTIFMAIRRHTNDNAVW